jgi:hypothetical protein
MAYAIISKLFGQMRRLYNVHQPHLADEVTEQYSATHHPVYGLINKTNYQNSSAL